MLIGEPGRKGAEGGSEGERPEREVGGQGMGAQGQDVHAAVSTGAGAIHHPRGLRSQQVLALSLITCGFGQMTSTPGTSVSSSAKWV